MTTEADDIIRRFEVQAPYYGIETLAPDGNYRNLPQLHKYSGIESISPQLSPPTAGPASYGMGVSTGGAYTPPDPSGGISPSTGDYTPPSGGITELPDSPAAPEAKTSTTPAGNWWAVPITERDSSTGMTSTTGWRYELRPNTGSAVNTNAIMGSMGPTTMSAGAFDMSAQNPEFWNSLVAQNAPGMNAEAVGPTVDMLRQAQSMGYF